MQNSLKSRIVKKGGGGQIPTFILFFILASKWSETSRNAKKNFSLCEGSGGGRGGQGGSEDQIWGNILSIFNFSRGKIIFFQICMLTDLWPGWMTRNDTC